MRIAIAVNCFVFEPMRKRVLGRLGVLVASSATPYPLLSTTAPSRATSTEPRSAPLAVSWLRYASSRAPAAVTTVVFSVVGLAMVVAVRRACGGTVEAHAASVTAIAQ